MILSGRKVIIQEPFKTFGWKILKCKGRFSRKTQRVKYHAGWVDLIPDGQSIMTIDTVTMNQKTWDALENHIQKRLEDERHDFGGFVPNNCHDLFS